MKIPCTTCCLLALLAFLPAPAPAGDMGQEAVALVDDLTPIGDAEWTLQNASHLLRRAGFGGTRQEIEALLALGPQGAVDRLLDWSAPEKSAPSPSITVTSRPARTRFMGLSREERQKVAREHRRRDRMQFWRVREWWMQMMIRSDHPLRERLTLMWHGHFTSGFRDVRNSYHMYMQNTLLRRHAAGNFRTLLHEISRDPAMLEYLDNRQNRAAKPNENYAREVMELFTMGVGNYTEADIKEAARAFTGWTFQGNHFFADERSHDSGSKTFLGRTGNFDGAGVLDIILEQPATSRYLARKIFAYFAHAWPGQKTVEGLAKTLRRGGWELKPMLRRLFLSRSFYAPHSVATKVKSPVDLLVGLYRQLGMDSKSAPGLSFIAEFLGQGLLEPPNVKGWPGGRDWITTSHLLNRYNAAGALVGLPTDKMRAMRNGRGMRMGMTLQRMQEQMAREAEGAGQGDEMAPAERERQRRQRFRRGRRGFDRLPTYDVTAEVRRRGLSTPDEIVDHFTKTLLAVPVTASMRRTFVDYLTRDGGFQLDNAYDAKQRLHGLLRLIVSAPEFQLF